MSAAGSDSIAAVEIEGLTHRYGTQRAINDLSLSVLSGERFGILGPNGSGKTTLFRILSTLIRPQQGRVRMLGLELPSQEALVRQRIGVLFQAPALDAQLTAAENLMHHGHLYGWSGAVLRERIDELLAAFDLADRAYQRVARFSGGMQRRVEIAKALLHRPQLLLLDEPSTGLDPSARLELRRMLDEVRQQGVTVLLTTHLLDEADRCDRLAVLDHGRLLACESPGNLKQQVGGEVITIQSAQPEPLVKRLSECCALEGRVVDRQVRLELPDAHRQIERIVGVGNGLIESLSIGRPTLEDVFVHLTGRSFRKDAGPE